ncbi:MAG: S41 family peptidase, partial [Phycisphaerales bacterium]
TSPAATPALREAFASLEKAVAKREQTRAEKLAEVDKVLNEKLAEPGSEALSEAIKKAVERYMLSTDKNAFMHEPRIMELIRRADTAARDAEARGDWFTANELFFRLNVLLEEEETYKPDVKRLGLRLSMIRLYAPERFWKLRNDERIAAGKSELPPYNGLGESFKEKLAGIDKGSVFRAIASASRQHIEKVEMRRMIMGGLESVRTMVTTTDLETPFPSLKNAAAKDAMLAFLNHWSARLNDPEVLITNQSLLDCIDDLLATNRSTVAFPDTAVLHEFGNGAMGRLDDFSAIVWPDELARFNRMTEGKFRGVGVQIQMDDETQMIKVVTPLEGTPAQIAGVRSGDLIKKIDGKSAVGISLNQAVDLITGPEGTSVQLTIERTTDQKDESGKEITEDIEFDLVRALIRTATVKGWRREGAKEDQWDWLIDPVNRIGYVRLTQFTDESTKELHAAIEQMQAQARRTGGDSGTLAGMILDLRYNPGGLLTEAVSVANTFIDRGTIVSTEGTLTGETKSAEPGKSKLGGTPLVVLINEGSASASEIVSGAIRHYADKGEVKALLIGQRSFGKGSVQNVWNLSRDSKMKLTTQYYKLPDGRIIHRKPGASMWGVDPHLKIAMLPEQESDALRLRQDADVLPIDKDGNVLQSSTPRPDPARLIADGLDLQLQTALVVLQTQAVTAPEQARLPQ